MTEKANFKTSGQLNAIELKKELREKEREIENLKKRLNKQQASSSNVPILSEDHRFEYLPGLYYVFSIQNLNLISWNKRLETVFGKSAAELKNTSILDFFSSTQHENVYKSIKQTTEKGCYKAELPVEINGKQVFYLFESHIITFNGDKYISGIGLNIQRRKNAERDLLHSQNALRTAFNAMDALVMVVDYDTHEIILQNHRSHAIFGTPQTSGKCFHAFWGETSTPCNVCFEHRNLGEYEAQKALQLEYFYDKLGKWYMISNQLVNWIEGRRAILCVATDITYIKKAEETEKDKNKKILRQNQRLQRMQEIASEYKKRTQRVQELAKMGNYVTYVKENYWVASKQFYELFGLPQKEKYTMEEFQSLVHPDDVEEVMNVFNNCIKNHLPFNYNYRCIKQDTKEVIYVESHSEIQYNDQGEPVKIIGMKQDITRQKEYEIDLKNTIEKAQESDRLKSAFLANVSHEIRTPLNGILGFAGLLTRNGLSSEKQKQYNNLINENSHQLLSIINDVLEVSKIQAQQIPVEAHQFDLYAMIVEIIQQNEELFSQKNISLKGNIPDETIIIQSDEQKVQRIIQRLLNNAFKFTNSGEVLVSVEKEADRILFSIKDTGIGIPIELHEKIFEAFRQKELAFSRTYGGTGLGLTIARGLARILNGDIWVESETGYGAEFFFTLPIEYQNNHKQYRTYKQNCIKNSKILLVEDSSEHLLLLKDIITQEGANVYVADNGINALKQIYKNPDMDLVLMDIKMPHMDGFETATRIKEHNKEIIIIGQSLYYGTSEEIRRILLGPFDDYLKKPISKELLVSRIKAFLCDI